MIFDEIVIHNFCVFRGEHHATLTPPSKKRPIVLFGGLNGCGKTTILEALQLALYGKLSPSRQGNGNYEDYLKGTIHRGCKPREGAAVEIAFRSLEEGKERRYRVNRSWAIPRKRVMETLTVSVDGHIDKALSDTWPEHVERFIPERLSHLFLFDGERIEALADPSQSMKLLSYAIHALLGVDLVEQLRTDLLILDRRKRKETKSGPDRKEIETAEEELATANQRMKDLKQERAALQNKRDREAKLLADLKRHLSLEGGDLVEQQQEFEKEHASLKGKLEAVRKNLIEIVSGSLPLILAKNSLADVAVQAKKEEDFHRRELLRKALAERDARLITRLKEIRATSSVVETVRKFLKNEEKRLDSRTDCYLHLEAGTHRRIDFLLESLPEDMAHGKRLLRQEDSLQRNVESLERKLAAVPEKGTLARIYSERDEGRKRLADHERKIAHLEEEIRKARLERERLALKLDKLLRGKKQTDLDNRDIKRFLTHASRVGAALERFRVQVTAQYAQRLSKFILDGYTQLLRKESLVDDLEIDPDSCALSLWNKKHQLLDPKTLSAGERQLLAISILWGLGQATGRPLPVVVDTPLGRLDSTHRSHLVERYFPFASHQVLLLSTDKEIDETYFKALKPRIGHAYRLEYDEGTESSSIRPGYFW